jgi:hypothetical protein
MLNSANPSGEPGEAQAPFGCPGSSERVAEIRKMSDVKGVAVRID